MELQAVHHVGHQYGQRTCAEHAGRLSEPVMAGWRAWLPHRLRQTYGSGRHRGHQTQIHGQGWYQWPVVPVVAGSDLPSGRIEQVRSRTVREKRRSDPILLCVFAAQGLQRLHHRLEIHHLRFTETLRRRHSVRSELGQRPRLRNAEPHVRRPLRAGERVHARLRLRASEDSVRLLLRQIHAVRRWREGHVRHQGAIRGHERGMRHFEGSDANAVRRLELPAALDVNPRHDSLP